MRTNSKGKARFACFALAVAVVFVFSCTSDIETAEEFLDKLKSSSSSISSSSSSFQSGLTYCHLPNGVCASVSIEACYSLGGILVEVCPSEGSSSSLSSISSSSSPLFQSSSSLQTGDVWCIIGSNCMETAQSICDYLGTQVPACP